MTKAGKPRLLELELVDVASKQTLKKEPNPGFLPRTGETILFPARASVLGALDALEYFMDYPDTPGEPEAQTVYFKIAIHVEREP